MGTPKATKKAYKATKRIHNEPDQVPLHSSTRS